MTLKGSQECVELELRRYRRRFRIPLKTSHGSWLIREGMLLRLTRSAGEYSYGEIAPIPWFGSETVEDAWDYCRRLPAQITQEHIQQIPKSLPSTRFGLESAWLDLFSPSGNLQRIPLCGLLPAGAPSLEIWRALWKQGYRTLKWKIGVEPIDREIGIWRELLEDLPSTARIRLDANGGLTRSEMERWLQESDPERIEFLEQPLPPSCWSTLLEMHRDSPIPIALDESVATLEQVEHCYHQGWRGIMVIKPGIMGSLVQFRQLIQRLPLDCVLSSVFETPVGAYHAACLVQDLSSPSRAVGFGIDHVFREIVVPVAGLLFLNRLGVSRPQIYSKLDDVWNHFDSLLDL